MGLLLRRPELLPRLDRRLQESSLAPLSAADFGYTAYQWLLGLLHQALEQDQVEITQFVQIHATETLREVLTGLSAVPYPKGSDDRLLDELTDVVLRLRRQTLSEGLNQMRYLLEESRQSGQPETAYLQTVLEYTRSLNLLDLARKKMSETRRE